MAFYPIEKLHRLHDGYQRAITLSGEPLLVLQAQGQIHILRNVCPHMDAPLTYATVKQGVLRCPLHGIEFYLNNGEAVRSVVGSLRKYPVVYVGDQVGVDLP
jgi:3-phenylpropionate/trans-cinnamate dioxygenase ferredoxin subunit